MSYLPLTADQSRTATDIQSSLRHLRNVLRVIQSEYESLGGCLLAIGSDALHIIAPQDNLQDIADDMGAIAYETYQGLGLTAVKLVSGGEVIRTLEVAV